MASLIWNRGMRSKGVIDPSDLPPWKRKRPPGKGRSLAPVQIEAAKLRASLAGRKYPNLVDNMWAARHIAPGPLPDIVVDD